MTSVVAKLVPALSVVCPLVAAQSAVAPLTELTASVVAKLVAAQSVTAPLVPAQSANPTGMPDPEYNVIVFLIDDVGREYYDVFEQTSYNPASPGTRVDPVSPAWCANQWTEVARDESTFPYPPTPVLRDLAVNGLVLPRMHVAAMCSPTRSSLLTGRSNIQHSLGNAIQINAAADTDTGIPFAYTGTTIYQRMEQQGSGYGRYHIGKWHMSDFPNVIASGFGALGLENTEHSYKQPVERGYASFYYGSIENLGPAPPGWEGEIAEDPTSPGDYPMSHAASDLVVATHDARVRTIGDRASLAEATFTIEVEKANCLIAEVREARQLITDAAFDGQPFLMNVWFHAVHDPTGWDEIGGANLSDNGYHSYTTSNPGGAISGTTAHPGIVKAFVESVDTAMGNILDALTTAQRARTMVVFISDNGSTSDMLGEETDLDALETSKPTVPASSYSVSHTKRSPWEGGIAAACVINGPGVVSPGNGTVPRFWPGLCGIEDLYAQICRWTGTHFPSDINNYTQVLDKACKNTSSVGRDVYIQRAFQNGYSDDMFSEDQGGGVRFVSAQSAEGWKLLWVRAGAALDPATDPPTPGSIGSSTLVTWLWQLYDMTNDPQEATDLFYDSGSFADPTDYEAHTVQDRYDALTSGQKAQFNKMYAVIAAEGTIPPGMEVVVS